MPFSTKAELKTAFTSWSHRSGLSVQADDCIKLAEARLNRELGEVLTSGTLTGTLNSREISVSGNSVAQPVALFLAETGLDERELTKKMDGTFSYSSVSGRPSAWAYVAGTSALGASTAKIVLDRPLDAAYPFRFKHRQKFSLAADGDSNWLLAEHPDVYLAAVITWGALFTDDDGKAGKWAGVLEDGIPEVIAYIEAQNQAEASLDPALVMMAGGAGRYNINTDQ